MSVSVFAIGRRGICFRHFAERRVT